MTRAAVIREAVNRAAIAAEAAAGAGSAAAARARSPAPRRTPVLRAAALALCALASMPLPAQPPSGQQRAESAGSDLLGTPAPDLVLETIDGESIDLGAYYGDKAVYLKFWATWCVPCRQQMPHFEDAYETAGEDLVVLGIDTGFNDSLPEVRAVIAEAGLNMPIVIDDGRLAEAFSLRVTPQHVVIGRDGRIDYVGFMADERLDDALRDARAPTAPPAATAHVASLATLGTKPTASVGDALPDLSAATLEGRPFRSYDPADPRPTVLVFISSWCESYLASSRPALAASCKQVREQVASLSAEAESVRWLGVASGLWATPAELGDYEDQYAPGIPLTMDESGEWFRTFDVMRTPTLVIADAGGSIVARVEGFDPALGDAIRRALEP
jgi:thiol-disulfide isomerase/thioredoxin